MGAEGVSRKIRVGPVAVKNWVENLAKGGDSDRSKEVTIWGRLEAAAPPETKTQSIKLEK